MPDQGHRQYGRVPFFVLWCGNEDGFQVRGISDCDDDHLVRVRISDVRRDFDPDYLLAVLSCVELRADHHEFDRRTSRQPVFRVD